MATLNLLKAFLNGGYGTIAEDESDDSNIYRKILDDNPGGWHRLALVLEVIAFGFWFIMCLSRTADTWFCNSLLNLCDIFHLRAGIVSQLLALAGALPDILSQISCMSEGEEAPDMSIGEVVGNAFMLYGLLIPLLHLMVPHGTIAINKKSFLYDNVWFFITTALLIGLGYIGSVPSWVIIIFFIAYIIYFALSIHFFDRKKKDVNIPIDLEDNDTDSLPSLLDDEDSEAKLLINENEDEKNKENVEDIKEYSHSDSHETESHPIKPIDENSQDEEISIENGEMNNETENIIITKKEPEGEDDFEKVEDFSVWFPKGWFISLIGWGPKVMNKITAIIAFPFTFFQVFAIPSVAKETYSRLTSIFGHAGSILFIIYRCEAITEDNLSYAIPICLLCGIALAIAFGILTGKKPFSKVMNAISTILALASSVFFMDIFADNLVNLLKAFGEILSIPESVLGIILAYAAASSDISGNIAVARSGNAVSAVGACAQASLINALLGTGVSWIPSASKTKFGSIDFDINMHSIINLSCVLVIIVFFSICFGIIPLVYEKKGLVKPETRMLPGAKINWSTLRSIFGLIIWVGATLTIILCAIFVDEKK